MATHEGKHDGISALKRQERITQLVLRRSKLSDDEAALLREVFPDIRAAHHDLVWDRLKRRCLELADAEELLQEAFLGVSPERSAAILPTYHVMNEAARQALDAHWQMQLAANPEMRVRFENALGLYTAWLRAWSR